MLILEISWKKKYPLAGIQNKIIVTRNGQGKIENRLYKSLYLTKMMDETADISSKEHVASVFKFGSDNIEVNEKFIGLYKIPSIIDATLASVAKDTSIMLKLSLSKLQGHC